MNIVLVDLPGLITNPRDGVLSTPFHPTNKPYLLQIVLQEEHQPEEVKKIVAPYVRNSDSLLLVVRKVAQFISHLDSTMNI